MLPESAEWLDGDIIDYVLEEVLNLLVYSFRWRSMAILTVTVIIIVCKRIMALALRSKCVLGKGYYF